MSKKPKKPKLPLVTLILGIIFFLLIGGLIYFFFNLKSTPSSTSLNAVSVPQDSINPTPDVLADQLLSECGAMPADVDIKINKQDSDVVKGPWWSLDCEYIVWSKGNSGAGLGQGVFAYQISTKQFKTIYQPKKNNETVELVSWEDTHIIDYKAADKTYVYDLDANSVNEK